MRSLIVEDEAKIAASVARLLDQLNGVSDIVGTLGEAEQALGSFTYDLAVVDRMLPDGDGLRLLSMTRALAQRPAIIMLTARDAKEDIVDGLNGGADDYLAKPFEPQEFLARVRAMLRRPRIERKPLVTFGNVTFDTDSNETAVDGSRMVLRRREALILEALLHRQERVVTREVLIEAVYGFDDAIESNTLEAQVSRLRKRLLQCGGNVEIRSMRGIGYIIRCQIKCHEDSVRTCPCALAANRARSPVENGRDPRGEGRGRGAGGG